MPIKYELNKRSLAIMVGICLLAFALRLWNISVADYDLDEAWTYTNVLYAQDPETFDQIYREPNNTLHILTVIPLANIVWSKIGFRFLSVAAGMLTVAVIGRLAFRLYGREAAWVAALIAALSVGVVDYSQHVRPYAFAFLFAVLAILAWRERKKRLNMLYSSLVPLFHIGAFPVVMLQDALTLWRIIRGKYVNKLDWIIRRIPPYSMLLLILYLVYLRRLAGKVISSGQPTPTPLQVFEHWAHVTVGDMSISLWLFGVAIVAVAILAFWQRNKIENLHIPLLWIAISYGILVTMTIISDGPIKFFHVTHVAFATALLIGGIVPHVPRIAAIGLVGVVVVASAIGLRDFHSQPYSFYTETYEELTDWRTDETIYFEVVFPVQALALAAPLEDDLAYLEYIPEDAPQPDGQYYYLAYSNFDPGVPETCTNEVWRYGSFHLHDCN